MLASPADVAHALGLEDENELTASQQARVEGLLERVSRRFQREAGRTLTAGAVTVRALTVEGRVHLPDPRLETLLRSPTSVVTRSKVSSRATTLMSPATGALSPRVKSLSSNTPEMSRPRPQ